MKKVFGICDLDKSYVEVLTRYINRREGCNFNVVGFSKPEALSEFAMHEKFSILIISTSFIEEMEHFSIAQDIVPKDTFILTEANEPGGYKFPEIYKYQSTEHILREVLKNIDRRTPERAGLMRSSFVTSVYSPIGRCGKTSYAISIAKKYSEKLRTLLVSFDFCTGHNEFENNGCNVSDLLYMSGACDMSALEEAARASSQLVTIGEANCFEDIRNLSPEDFVALLENIKNCGFQKIVIDIGNLNCKKEALDASDEIFLPLLRDELSMKKYVRWEEMISNSNEQSLLEKIKKIYVNEQ